MVIIPASLKGKDYCGSFRICMDDNLSLKDAKRIMAESPNLGIRIVEQEEQPKPRRKKRGTI